MDGNQFFYLTRPTASVQYNIGVKFFKLCHFRIEFSLNKTDK